MTDSWDILNWKIKGEGRRTKQRDFKSPVPFLQDNVNPRPAVSLSIGITKSTKKKKKKNRTKKGKRKKQNKTKAGRKNHTDKGNLEGLNARRLLQDCMIIYVAIASLSRKRIRFSAFITPKKFPSLTDCLSTEY